MSTLYRDGRVYGGGSALLVDGPIIRWVGDSAAAPAAGQTVELAGAAVTPAFVDAHVHCTATGLALTGLDLHGTRSLAEALDRVEAAARAGRGRTILGSGWDETTWPERRTPTRHELDRAGYGGAVYLARVDGHSTACSSALLATAPRAAEEAGWEDSGVVRLDAHHAVRRAAYAAITPAQRGDAQRATRARAASLGIGCLQEMSGPEVAGRHDLEALLALAATEPGPTVAAYWGQLHSCDVVADLGPAGAGGDLFCDGSLGSHTASLGEPYADAAPRGVLRHRPEEVREHVRAATVAGVQAGFHVIGDVAIDQAVTAVAAVAVELGVDAVRACRHRLEHAEMPRPEHLGAMAALGMVASVQPAFDAAWGGPDRMYAARLGPERARGLNPFGAFAAAGVPLALGSDAPVTALDPWGGVVAAVRHRTEGAGIGPEQAFRAATEGGWYAARCPSAGRLEPGAGATFAVWDGGGDVLERAMAGDSPRCRTTVVNGQPVYDAEGAQP
ncbi:amidohydrolase [soil metagenome]